MRLPKLKIKISSFSLRKITDCLLWSIEPHLASPPYVFKNRGAKNIMSPNPFNFTTLGEPRPALNRLKCRGTPLPTFDNDHIWPLHGMAAKFGCSRLGAFGLGNAEVLVQGSYRDICRGPPRAHKWRIRDPSTRDARSFWYLEMGWCHITLCIWRDAYLGEHTHFRYSPLSE